jgi:ketosteroid isomerase-like protein
MPRKVTLFLLLISAFSIAVAAQGKAKKNDAESEKAVEIMGVIGRWADAIRDRDMKMLDLLFSDDLIITTFDGKTRGKTEELEILKPNPEMRTVSVINEDVGIKLFGNVAIVTALTEMQFVISGKDISAAFRYTVVFVKQEGRWQMVVLQTTRLPAIKTN